MAMSEGVYQDFLLFKIEKHAPSLRFFRARLLYSDNSLLVFLSVARVLPLPASYSTAQQHLLQLFCFCQRVDSVLSGH